MLSLLIGCAMPQTASLVESPGDLPARAEVASVPFFPQEQYYCGPAALAMALAWSGLTVTQDDLVSQVYTPGKEGSLQADILAAARRNGRLAIQVGDLSDVLAEIAAGHPVLVFQNLALEWYPQCHFAVAIGYDLDTREIVLHSGRVARRRTSLSTFEATWERGGFWAVVVLPPERLPARGTERAVVRAAAGLERAARYKEAAVAYETILQRWPDSYVALMGLGNAHYATGNYREAEAAFRGAIARHPERPDPWNNLAHALVMQGLRAKAETAAHNAVRLAKRDPGPYIATLREISSEVQKEFLRLAKEGHGSAQYGKTRDTAIEQRVVNKPVKRREECLEGAGVPIACRDAILRVPDDMFLTLSRTYLWHGEITPLTHLRCDNGYVTNKPGMNRCTEHKAVW
jgi:tetratricopeptide (TPR) repeat protein